MDIPSPGAAEAVIYLAQGRNTHCLPIPITPYCLSTPTPQNNFRPILASAEMEGWSAPFPLSDGRNCIIWSMTRSPLLSGLGWDCKTMGGNLLQTSGHVSYGISTYWTLWPLDEV